LSKNELGSWCHERLVGVPHKYKAQKEGFLADSVSEKLPSQWPPTSTVSVGLQSKAIFVQVEVRQFKNWFESVKEKINTLLAGLRSVHIERNSDLGLKNDAVGLQLQAAFSRPWSQFFTTGIYQLSNDIIILIEKTLTQQTWVFTIEILNNKNFKVYNEMWKKKMKRDN